MFAGVTVKGLTFRVTVNFFAVRGLSKAIPITGIPFRKGEFRVPIRRPIWHSANDIVSAHVCDAEQPAFSPAHAYTHVTSLDTRLSFWNAKATVEFQIVPR